MHDAEGRILAANADALARGRVATIGFGPPGPNALTDGAQTVEAFNTDLRAHRALRADVQTSFGSWFTPAEAVDVAVVRLPKERERLRMWLAMARASVTEGATIAVAGRNDAGIKGAERHVADLVGEPVALDARAHCRLYVTDGVAPAPAAIEDWRTTWTALGLTIVGYPGVFSTGELDPGTALLLDALPDPRGLDVLDVGCGSGVIAAWLAARGAGVTAVDADALAVRATRETLEANGSTATVQASDVYDDVDGAFGMVVSNPPFHAGVQTSSAVARRIIANAPVTRRGSLVVVGNRHLDHGSVMRESFDHVEVLAENSRYRVWRARDPRRPGRSRRG